MGDHFDVKYGSLEAEIQEVKRKERKKSVREKDGDHRGLCPLL